MSLPDVGAALRARPIDERHAFTLGAGESAYRVTSESSVIFGTRFRVIAAYPLHGNRETMEAVGTAYAIAIPLLLVIAALGGYFLASRSLAPVATMSAWQLISVPSTSRTMRYGSSMRRPLTSRGVRISAPKRVACVTARRARSHPLRPEGKPR